MSTRNLLPALAAIFSAPPPDTLGHHRSYYDPARSPRSRLHNHAGGHRYIPKRDDSPLANVLRARAEAKRQRRTAGRAQP